MTKAKARERAKAKAAQKVKKREANAAKPDNIKPGQFDPGSGSIKSPKFNANARPVGTARRGSARSR
ncbi:MAG: hypothetical protein HN478_05695 [Rhodospirillaceae bacterium]|jgi:hypothetical protein|nr:hypothetical protein [Rhodospirillaceae bacterium]MBT4490009.1 hypothetical protein [Rhodospirillaceae bacterium]MBT5195036.1 hypothetical protein [Rhodospirillaceae bacterium]MBT5897495.1 hypothetical protein [Rhodospirillaceae bacterium]MBT6427713.1 hypothetical protein [Rhodospirillaceae bacterium]